MTTATASTICANFRPAKKAEGCDGYSMSM
jgi:hypothetical protein